jgi:hypothetical protein
MLIDEPKRKNVLIDCAEAKLTSWNTDIEPHRFTAPRHDIEDPSLANDRIEMLLPVSNFA